MSRRTLNFDLPWKEDAKMVQCFQDPNNEVFTSDWRSIEPALPNAKIVSQSLTLFDITASPDACVRCEFGAELNHDGSAVRVRVARWRQTRPEGVRIQVVVDNFEAELESMTAQLSSLHNSFKADKQVEAYMCSMDKELGSIKAQMHSMEAQNQQLREQVASIAFYPAINEPAVQHAAQSVQSRNSLPVSHMPAVYTEEQWLAAIDLSSVADAMEWAHGNCYKRISQALQPLGVKSSEDMLLLHPSMVTKLTSIPVAYRTRLALLLEHGVTAQQRAEEVFSRYPAWLDRTFGVETADHIAMFIPRAELQEKLLGSSLSLIERSALLMATTEGLSSTANVNLHQAMLANAGSKIDGSSSVDTYDLPAPAVGMGGQVGPYL